jgi:hypothetical protein
MKFFRFLKLILLIAFINTKKSSTKGYDTTLGYLLKGLTGFKGSGCSFEQLEELFSHDQFELLLKSLITKAEAIQPKQKKKVTIDIKKVDKIKPVEATFLESFKRTMEEALNSAAETLQEIGNKATERDMVTEIGEEVQIVLNALRSEARYVILRNKDFWKGLPGILNCYILQRDQTRYSKIISGLGLLQNALNSANKDILNLCREFLVERLTYLQANDKYQLLLDQIKNSNDFQKFESIGSLLYLIIDSEKLKAYLNNVYTKYAIQKKAETSKQSWLKKSNNNFEIQNFNKKIENANRKSNK